jgi:ATP-dependent Lhr-like helicase
VRKRYPVPQEALEAALEALAASDEVVWGFFTPGLGEKEWADSRTLAAMQSRTLSMLRSEVSPVPPLRWQAEVARLQGVAPGTGGTGGEGIRRTLQILAGVALTPEQWTEEVLSARVKQFGSADLDPFFKSGEFVWVASQTTSGDRVRARILPRGTGNLLLPDAELARQGQDEDGLRGAAAQVRDFLESEGMASSSDLRAAMPSLTFTALRDALRELVVKGLVTGDSWSALVALVPRHPLAEGEYRAAVTVSGETYADRRERSIARRGAARRLRETELALRPEATWSLTARFAVMGAQAQPGRKAEARANVLLRRYGVVSRRAVEAEANAWSWGPVEGALALMELRGAARRGFFVHGLPGVQYALPGVVESLRAKLDASGTTLLTATDPAFVLDRSFEYPAACASLMRFSRVASTHLALAGDVPVLLAERNGEVITACGDLSLRHAVEAGVFALRDRLAGGRGLSARVIVQTWNGEPVLKSQGAGMLSKAGFGRDYPGMSFDAVRARTAGPR